MKNKIIAILILVFVLSPVSVFASGRDVCDELKGKILLQVEGSGEAWYVHPDTGKRIFLGRPDDAFKIMCATGVGVSNQDLQRFSRRAPDRLSGRILLQTEDKGQGYYVDPSDNELKYLGRPDDAFKIMKESALGISNNDLEKIEIDSSEPVITLPQVVIIKEASLEKDVPEEPIQADGMYKQLEMDVFYAVNEYRKKTGSDALVWSDDIAIASREHSQAMATGQAEFSHDGFDSRMKEISDFMPLSGMGENIAYNLGSKDPAGLAVSDWIASPGHRQNMIGDYEYTGIGVAVSQDGYYYFNQIFIK